LKERTMRKVLIKPSVLGLIINVSEDMVAEEEDGDHGVAEVEADLESILSSQWMNLVLAKMMVPEVEEDMEEVEARNPMIKGRYSAIRVISFAIIPMNVVKTVQAKRTRKVMKHILPKTRVIVNLIMCC